MRLGVDVLLSDADVRDAFDGDSQAKVKTPQQELRPLLYAAGDRGLADQSPLVGHPALGAVLQGRTRGQVCFKESLGKGTTMFTKKYVPHRTFVLSLLDV